MNDFHEKVIWDIIQYAILRNFISVQNSKFHYFIIIISNHKILLLEFIIDIYLLIIDLVFTSHKHKTAQYVVIKNQHSKQQSDENLFQIIKFNFTMDSPTNFRQISQLLNDRTRFVAVGDSAIDQLKLKYVDEHDVEELKYILGNVLAYPSTEVAELHRDSHKIGMYDVKRSALKENEIQRYGKITNADLFCPDCGFVKQTKNIPFRTSIQKIYNFGVCNTLYFKTLLNLIKLLILFFVIYGIFALVTNIIAANKYRQSDKWLESKQYQKLTEQQQDKFLSGDQNKSWPEILVLSLGSKQLHDIKINETYYEIQCWIGLGLVVIWGLFFLYIKYREIRVEAEIIKDIKTVSTFSIMVEKIPPGITEQQFQKQFGEYWKGRMQDSNEEPIDLDIVKLNFAKPFSLTQKDPLKQQIKLLNKQYKKQVKKFIKWIKYRKNHQSFQESSQERMAAYREFNHLKERRENVAKQVVRNIRQGYALQTPQIVAFITFRSSKTPRMLLKQTKQTCTSKIGKFLICCKKKNEVKLTDKDGNTHMAILRVAPQPEDVLWDNLGQSPKRKRNIRIASIIITILILGASFVIILFLARYQKQRRDNGQDSQGFNLTGLISFIISLSIPIFNAIIQIVLRQFTYMQRDDTRTVQQASLGIKATFASLINTIAIPIVVAYTIKKNLYGVGGLSADIFFLGITSAFIPAIMRVINPGHYISRILAWMAKKPSSKLKMNQEQLNAKMQFKQFEPGFQSLPVVNIFLFACFYAPLQPIVIVFALIGNSLIYQTQKYSIFNHKKRPVPGGNMLNRGIWSIIRLGPLFYSLGSFCWSHFFPQDYTIDTFIAPNLIAIIISGIIVVIPYGWIASKLNKKYFGEPEFKEQFYEQERPMFESEYDRLNPLTAEPALREYLQFNAEYRGSLDPLKPEGRTSIQKMFVSQLKSGKFVNRDSYEDQISDYVKIRQQNKIGFPPIPRTFYLFGGNNIFRWSKAEQAERPSILSFPYQNWATIQQITGKKPQKEENKMKKCFGKIKQKGQKVLSGEGEEVRNKEIIIPERYLPINQVMRQIQKDQAERPQDPLLPDHFSFPIQQSNKGLMLTSRAIKMNQQNDKNPQK